MMSEREKEKFIRDLTQVLEDLKNAIIDTVNELPDATSNLQDAVRRWKEKRQVLNNKNTGIILSFGKPCLVVFPLHRDEKKNKGQKNLSSEPEKTLTDEDENFLKQIGIHLP